MLICARICFWRNITCKPESLDAYYNAMLIQKINFLDMCADCASVQTTSSSRAAPTTALCGCGKSVDWRGKPLPTARSLSSTNTVSLHCSSAFLLFVFARLVSVSVCLPVCVSVFLSAFHLVCLSVCLNIIPFLPVSLSACMVSCLAVSACIFNFFVCLFAVLSVSLSV